MSTQAAGDIDLQGTSFMSLMDYVLQELKSVSMKSAEHFAEFKCSDGTRYIHQLVMRSKLPGFVQDGGRIPVPVAIFDHVVEYLYRGKLTSVKNEELIGVFEAAKYLNLNDLVREVKSLRLEVLEARGCNIPPSWRTA